MKLKNMITGQSVELSDDMHWQDEHSWSPVVSSVEDTLNGGQVIDVSVRKTGRNITLAAPDNDMAWHARTVVDALAAWARLPLQIFELQFMNGKKFKVVFRHHEAPVIETKPMKGFSTDAENDPWQVKIKLMEIA